MNSMTGYGQSEKIIDGRDITVEIKSVNHRFFDFTARTSRGFGFLEEKLKTCLQNRVSRGKLDVSVTVETLETSDAQVTVNHSLAAGYIASLREMQQRYGLRDDISVMSVARYPDLFTVRRAPEDEEQVWACVNQVLEEALVSFFRMREAEGQHLKEDLSRRADSVLEMVASIETRSPQTVAEYRSKLTERLTEILNGSGIDEQRVLTEAAVFADKVSVDEETVRLRSHVGQFRSMLESDEAVGRRLDFIVQEMNREANTIGSKCVDAQIAHTVVDLKAEIEKIREQIQNIE